MGLEVRRAISLHENKFLTEDQLFNSLIDLAIGGSVDRVMIRIPSDYLVRFRDWLDRQPRTETLLDLRSGLVSEQDRDAVAAIRGGRKGTGRKGTGEERGRNELPSIILRFEPLMDDESQHRGRGDAIDETIWERRRLCSRL